MLVVSSSNLVSFYLRIYMSVSPTNPLRHNDLKTFQVKKKKQVKARQIVVSFREFLFSKIKEYQVLRRKMTSLFTDLLSLKSEWVIHIKLFMQMQICIHIAIQ